MHALLVSLGTNGDVYPFIALGVELRRRGHEVTLAANEPFKELAESLGLSFCALVSRADTEALLRNRNLWHPFKSSLAGARWARKTFSRHYPILAEASQRFPNTTVISYPPVFAARVLQEKFDLPLISVLPMPWMLLSNTSPPIPPTAAVWPMLAHPVVARLFWRFGEWLTDMLLGKHLNDLRRSLGLTPLEKLYRWCFSPRLTIGLFPDWFATPQRDWPGNTRLTAFPVFDGEHENGLLPDLRQFLKAGPPPVAFTFGTGMMHSQHYFDACLAACQSLGIRGLFLTRFSDQIPVSLPAFIHHCNYAPFSEVFPHCAAIVHHGGIGTTARALTAGIPQLITPFAWDQPDNAFRVKKLGAGDWLNPKELRTQLVPKLKALLQPTVKLRCQKLKDNFATSPGLQQAAMLVENELVALAQVTNS